MNRYLLTGKYSAAIMLVCGIVLIVNTVLPTDLNQFGIMKHRLALASGQDVRV
ncbi:MAG TPA: hypothetical protein VIC51_05090 [Psychromonas sp.]